MNSTNSLKPTCDQPTTDEIVAWLLEGHRDADIRQAIKEKWPTEDVVALQNSAVEHFRRAAHCEPEVIVGFALEAWRDLYRRMVQIGDFAGASKAVKEMVGLTKHVQQFREATEGEPAKSTGTQAPLG